jgi:glycosyltransferase involved in cell wall biosynthesis
MDALKKALLEIVGVSTPSFGKPSVKGHIDSMDGRRIKGWFFSEYVDDELALFINEKLCGIFVANKYREDLTSKYREVKVAFEYSIPAGITVRVGDEVKIVSVKSEFELKGSPIIVSEEQIGTVQYHVDSIEGNSVKGWVWTPGKAMDRIYVEARLSGRFICATEASEFREDLQRNNIGDGRYGFNLNFGSFKSDDELKIYFYHGKKLLAVESAGVSTQVSNTKLNDEELILNSGVVNVFSWAKIDFKSRLLSKTSEKVLRTLSQKHSDYKYSRLKPSSFFVHICARHLFDRQHHLRTESSIINAFFDVSENVYKHRAATIPFSPSLGNFLNERVDFQGRRVSKLLKAFIIRFRPGMDIVTERGYQNACYDLMVTVIYIWGISGDILPSDVLCVLSTKEYIDGLGEAPAVFKLLLENNNEYNSINGNAAGFLMGCILSLAGRGLINKLKFPLLDKLMTETQALMLESEVTDSLIMQGIRSNGIPMDSFDDVLTSVCNEYFAEKVKHPENDEPALVRVFGDISKANGLSTNIQNTVDALEFKGIPFELYNTSMSGVTTPIQSSSGVSALKKNINIFHIQPDNMPEKLLELNGNLYDDAYNIGFFMWETNVAPQVHSLGIDLVDEIWTATQYTYDYFKSITDKPVTLIPHAVNPELPSERNFRRELGLDGKFIFYYAFDVYSCIERKNPIDIIYAFQKAFPGVHDVVLLIKVNHADQHANVETNFGQFEEVLELAANDSRIVLFSEQLSESDNSSITNSCDCFVSLHRSEGFGYSLAEAMYFGKPVIATRHSGNLQFMNDENSYLVDLKGMKYIKPKQFLYDPIGGQWADPCVESACEAMKTVKSEGESSKGIFAKNTIVEEFSLEVMAEKYSKRLLVI